MFTCKQVSKSLAENDYQELSLVKKCMLKVHVTLCFVCGKFNRQVMDSHDMCRHYKVKEQTLEPSRPKLDESQKQQLKKLLHQQNKLGQED